MESVIHKLCQSQEASCFVCCIKTIDTLPGIEFILNMLIAGIPY